MEKRIPAPVWVTAGALGLVTAVQAALALLLVRGGKVGWGQFLFAAVLAVALLAGLLRGSRLAWLWGRQLALLLALLVSARTAVALVRGESEGWLMAVVVGGMAAPLFVAAYALTRPSAIAFYDLVCPLCSAETRVGADLLFRKARCRACGNLW
jgi:hypothetical protein